MSLNGAEWTKSTQISLVLIVIVTLWGFTYGSLATDAAHVTDGKAAGFVMEALLAHPALLRALLIQGLAIFSLYLLFFLAIAELGRRRSGQPRWYQSSAAGILLTWLMASWLLLRLNAHWFPYSVWSSLAEPLFDTSASICMDVAAPLWIFWRLVLTLAARGHQLRQLRYGRAIAASLAILVGGLAAATMIHSRARVLSVGEAQILPNIVVIGLDSLQRDLALGIRGPKLPGLEAFRAAAFVQGNVVSPLARTFPAWVTMLTGVHPQRSHARSNLTRQADIDRRASIAFTLQRHGYRTVYATDETRFSNIGHEFGFDEVYGPTPGVSDYLLSQFGDQPLINLALTLPYAEVLLPALAGNRAFAQAYEPRQFVARLTHGLGPASNQPTFLAVHLCLAHWPYHAAKAGSLPISNELPYYAATRDLDQQFSLLLSRLTALGYVNAHSLVVVLADHGEGVDATSAPREVISHIPDVLVRQPPLGHGGTLLDPQQWQVFLMFSGRGAHREIRPGVSEQLASLEDLAPTLLRLAGLESASPYVLDVVQRQDPERFPKAPSRNYVVMETGFRPPHFDTTNPDPDAALRIAESSYDILADGRIEMKQAVFDAVVREKDLGITDGKHSLVAAFNETGRVLFSTDIQSRRWEIFGTTPPAQPVAIPLLEAACGVPELRAVISGYCDPRADHSKIVHAGDAKRNESRNHDPQSAKCTIRIQSQLDSAASLAHGSLNQAPSGTFVNQTETGRKAAPQHQRPC